MFGSRQRQKTKSLESKLKLVEAKLNYKEASEMSPSSVKKLDFGSGQKDDQISHLKQQNSNLESKYNQIEGSRKRDTKDYQDAVKYRSQSLASDILPDIDDLGRALETKVSDPKGQQLKKGVQMVYDHFKHVLQDHSITKIQLKPGDKFDPHKAQAVQTVAADIQKPKDSIVSILQDGYWIHDRVLRPAMVVVAE